jgi:hypothetical protein
MLSSNLLLAFKSMLRSPFIDSQTRKFSIQNYIQNSMQLFRARFRCDAFRNIAYYAHYIEAVNLLYPIHCLWLLGDVGNSVKTISAHSQIIPQGDRPMDTCPCLLPRVPYNTSHVYLTPRVHVFPPLVHGSISRDYTRTNRDTSLYTRLGQVILHMATLHHTTFSPHIRSIITSVFGRTTYQINTSL